MTEHLIAFTLACIVLVIIPGPNVALIVANSIRHGFARGLASSAGVALGIGTQLLLVVLGLAALIQLIADILIWVKWIGVAYLIYLGIKAWREPAEDLEAIQAEENGARTAFIHGFLIACINPKTLLFSVAFLPQFIVTGSDPTQQMAVLSMILMSIGFIGDSTWALFASSLRHVVIKYGRLRNKLTGGFLVGAGLALAATNEAK